MSILLTGGSGALGTELQKLEDFIAPSHKELDITSERSISDFFEEYSPNLIVHCAAYTDVSKAETEKKKCYDINVRGTANLAKYGIPMVYISTEYVFDGEKGNYTEQDIPNPRNFYALTKLLGEFEVKRTQSLIIRTILKPKPFEHAAACTNQYTAGDYVDVIAKEIMITIDNFDFIFNYSNHEILNIGTGRKSVFDLASQTREVIPITVETIGIRLPKDTSLDLTKWNKFKEHLCI